MKAVFIAAVLMGAQPSSAQSARIDVASWLQGCWMMTAGERTVEEHWMAPRGRSMVAVGRTVRGNVLAEYELVVLKEQDGRLAYEAHPSGQPTAVFLSRELSATTMVFENLQHDFPQRVGYRRDGADAMVAWIEGSSGGQVRRIEFPYRRSACEAR